MAIINHIRTQDYSSRASGRKSTNGDKSEYSSVSPTIDKLKERMEQNKAHGGPSGSFGTTSKPSTGTTGTGTSTPSTGTTGTGTLPGIGENTGESSPVDEYLKLLNGSGSYDDSYWTKISNALLSNNNHSRNKADAHEKYYTDLVADYKSQNPLETDWGKAIMAQYGLDGDSAASAELADSASSNGGNIDSYAEANARRQKLSYLNSGINAVNDASNQRFSNMLSALEKMGVDTANLLGIGTENVSSAMGAAQDRYAQDTDSTIAYNEMLQNLAPYYLSSDGSSSEASSLTATDRANIRKQLEDAYTSGGETGLLKMGESILADYSNDSTIDNLIEQYYQIITGSNGSGTGSSGTGSNVKRNGNNYVFSLSNFEELTDSDGDYSRLPDFVKKIVEQSAEQLNTTPEDYVSGIRSGKYTKPNWLTGGYISPSRFRQYFEDAEDNQGITGLPDWVQQKLREEAEEKGTTAVKYAKGILTGDYAYPSWLRSASYEG